MIDEVYNLETLENTLAAWLDGALNPYDDAAFMTLCSQDEELQEILDSNDQIEASYEEIVENGYELPYEMYGDFDIPLVDDEEVLAYSSYEYGDDDSNENNTVDEDDELFTSTDDSSGETDYDDCGLI